MIFQLQMEKTDKKVTLIKKIKIEKNNNLMLLIYVFVKILIRIFYLLIFNHYFILIPCLVNLHYF